MHGREVDGENVDQQGEMMEMLSSLLFRQRQPGEQIASDRARGGGQSSPSRENIVGVRTAGNFPAFGVVRVDEVRYN